MIRLAFWAYEGLYQGLHGIGYETVLEYDDLEDVKAYADQNGTEMSYDVMDSWDTQCDYMGDFNSYLDEKMDEGFSRDEAEEAFWEDLDAEKEQNIAYEYYPIDEEKAKGLTTQELDHILVNHSFDFFRDEYCREWTEEEEKFLYGNFDGDL